MRDVDDGGYHCILDRWEILPILVHRERRALLRRFAEKLRVVQQDIRSEDSLGDVKEFLLQERLQPHGRETLDIMGVDNHGFAAVQRVHQSAAPSRVDVFVALEELSDTPVEIVLHCFNFLR